MIDARNKEMKERIVAMVDEILSIPCGDQGIEIKIKYSPVEYPEIDYTVHGAAIKQKEATRG